MNTGNATGFPTVLRDLLMTEYALVVLFCIFLLEGAMLLYFMPSELIVPGAIYLMGRQWLVPIILVAVVGATLGQYALFTLAKRGGRQVLFSSSLIPITEAHLSKYEKRLDKWGPIAVAVSNSLLFTRGMITVPAGLGNISDRRFVLYSALGTLLFESLLAGLYLAAFIRFV